MNLNDINTFTCAENNSNHCETNVVIEPKYRCSFVQLHNDDFKVHKDKQLKINGLIS